MISEEKPCLKLYILEQKTCSTFYISEISQEKLADEIFHQYDVKHLTGSVIACALLKLMQFNLLALYRKLFSRGGDIFCLSLAKRLFFFFLQDRVVLI